MKLCSLVIIAFCIFYFNSNTLAQPMNSTNVDDILSRMSPEDKIGQLFLLGINGYNYNEINSQKLRVLRPGGIILFGRNIKSADQLSRLLFSFQNDAKTIGLPPLFTAVDQEGGSVTRLKHWPPIPSAAAVGRAGDIDLAYKMALFTGQILKTLGLNMNLAPVLDLSDPLEKSFIGSRSYGDDPEQVVRFGGAIITGYEAAGVISISKHFPGHGAAVADSHLSLPVAQSSLADLKANDLIPFQNLANKQRLPGLMVAHIAFPMVDVSAAPVTYSRKFLSTYLRSELNYKGLIMTDDLEMLGAQGIKDPGERAFHAIQAGADIIMVAWNPASQKRAYDGLLNALKTGRLSEARVNQSVRRILTAKNTFHIEDERQLPSKEELQVLVYHRELQAAIDRVVTKNLALSSVDEWTHFLNKSREVLLISTDQKFTDSFQHAFLNPRLRTLILNTESSVEDLRFQLSQYPKHYSLLYFAGSSHGIRLLRGLTRAERSRLYLITTELPYMVRSSADYKGVFYSYTKHPNLGALFYDSLLQAQGRAPAQTSQGIQSQ